MGRSLTGSQLKVIAICCMLIDHVGALWIGPAIGTSLYEKKWLICYLYTRLIGRLAFPLYAFLIAEGIHCTKNRAAYAGRLLLFALISEIPFDLALYGKSVCMDGQNVYFTLGLSVLMFVPGSLWLKLVLIPASCILLAVTGCDYGLIGPVIVLGMILGRKNWGKYLAACLTIGYGICILVPGIAGIILTFFYTGIWGIIVHFYYGQRGWERGKYFFYWFYPIHLLFLWAIRSLW